MSTFGGCETAGPRAGSVDAEGGGGHVYPRLGSKAMSRTARLGRPMPAGLRRIWSRRWRKSSSGVKRLEASANAKFGDDAKKLASLHGPGDIVTDVARCGDVEENAERATVRSPRTGGTVCSFIASMGNGKWISACRFAGTRCVACGAACSRRRASRRGRWRTISIAGNAHRSMPQ